MNNLHKNLTVTAHTGCEGTEQNSLVSIRTGAVYGADIVEFDIRFDKNNCPVLSHNEPNGGEVTLDEAFALVSTYDSLRVNLDIKCTDNLRSIQEAAKKYNISDRVFYTGVSESFVPAVRQDSPEIEYLLNMSLKPSEEQSEEYLKEILDAVIKCGAVGINLDKSGFSENLCKLFHRHNLKVSVWTVDEEDEMKNILSHGPDNITTRYPSKLYQILNN